MYSPEVIDIKQILRNYENYNRIIIEWLTYGSNNFYFQPFSIVDGFNKHHDINIKSEHHYSYKCILKASDIINFGVHSSSMRNDKAINLSYTTNQYKLLINHYQQQSEEFYLTIKATRGDVNNHFDHSNLKRDINHFRMVDQNIIENNILREQNFELIRKVKERKLNELTEKNINDVTVVITSCNRPELLMKTLDSFFKYNTYPIKEIIIIDDSGFIGINDFVLKTYKYNHFNLIYNKSNIGQVNSIDIAYRYVTSKYVFHCEEDWEFLQNGFIELSMDLLNLDNKIFTVWLRPHNDINNHPILYNSELINKCYKMDDKHSYMYRNKKYTWCGFTFNPGLRRTSDILKYHPYNKFCDKDRFRNEVTEYEINEKYRDDDYYAVITQLKSGYCKHIGYDHHVIRKDEK
jgi:hypothetical protein